MVPQVRWTYDSNARPQDPINFIFRGLTLEQILVFLSSKGWSSNVVMAYDQYVPDPDLHNLRKQNAQLQYGSLLKRLHVRLWEAGDEVIANVHHEIASIPAHIVQDYNSAEAYLARVCMANKSWKVKQDSLDLANFFGGHGTAYNDGNATLVTRWVKH
jgi:hypothetical protein